MKPKRGRVMMSVLFSLTVVEAGPDWFTVSLIPETLARTTLGTRAPGEPVNLEVDVLARHMRGDRSDDPPHIVGRRCRRGLDRVRQHRDQRGVELQVLDERFRKIRSPAIVLRDVFTATGRSRNDEREALLGCRPRCGEEDEHCRETRDDPHRSPQRRRSNHSAPSSIMMTANDHPLCQRSWVTARRAVGRPVRNLSRIAEPSSGPTTRPPDATARR